VTPVNMVLMKVGVCIGTLSLLLLMGPTCTINSIFYIFNYCIILILKNDVARNEIHNGPHPNLSPYLQRRAQIQDRQTHLQLQHDLMEHIWQRFGSDSQQD
jgi:hypothetical protein